MSDKIKEVIKQEYLKCAVDPVYFLKKYAVIQHPLQGKVPFALYPFQEASLKDFKDHNYNIILKARQLGISTLTAGYALWTLEVGRYPADEIVHAVTHFLLASPSDSDHWQCSSNRPPSESSDFTTTYLAIRALKNYSNEQQQLEAQDRYKSTLKWLLSATPETTEDKVFHLRTLYYLDAPAESIKRYATSLLKGQRDDGGWSQTNGMESDPYATATVLVGLSRTGQADCQQAAYTKGISYLLKHQTELGSWHVKSRSKPFQKYFETGFPHEKDQFISTSATAWATLALLLSLPPSESSDALRTKNQN